MFDNRPIGVLDSGVGGLTVLKELQNHLPNESIFYFGDNANVPYGNKSEEEIYYLTKRMIDFLIEKDVKLILVACNTISSILDRYFQDYSLPIISIIKPAVDYLIREKIREVGVIATVFTIESGAYEKLIRAGQEEVTIINEGSPDLANLIDSGNFTREDLQVLVDYHMDRILEKGNPSHLVLGCTHYPIALDNFKSRAPHINFINPAYEQVLFAEKLMKEKNLRADDKRDGDFLIYTSGKKEVYEKMLALLDMKEAREIVIL